MRKIFAVLSTENVNFCNFVFQIERKKKRKISGEREKEREENIWGDNA